MVNGAAPITWFIGRINSIVSSGADAVAGAIAAKVSPLAAVCFGIYIILITINYARGSEPEPVFDFGMRCLGFSIVIGLGLNAANYTSIVIPIVTGLGSDLATAVSGGVPAATSLDQLAKHYIRILDEGLTAVSLYDGIAGYVIYGIKAVLILLGLVPFLVAAMVVTIIADVGSVLVAMVGPLYFGFLLFPATRQYFSSWLNTALSYALVPVFVAVIATISVGISTEMLSGASSLDSTSLVDVFLASIGNLALLFLLRQIGSLASSLSAGGINIGTGGGLGSAASAINSSIQGSRREGSFKAVGNAGRAAGNAAARLARVVFPNSIRKAG